MTRKILWKLRQFARRLWVRATLVSCLALIAALSAPLSNYLPLSVATKIDRDTLSGLLQILTNSMLTVTTFSLSIMVTAHLAADSSATPRAHRLLQQDSRTQTVLATFIGAFVYALTLTIMLNLGLLAEDELAIVYFFTVAVILLVVIAILRWVGHLDGLGSVEATIRRAEERAAAEISRRNLIPYLGGRPRDAVAVPAKARRLEAASSGYLQDIDVRSLSEAVGPESRVWVEVAPGDWIVEGGLLAHVEATEWSEATIGALRAGFTFNDRREHGQDTTYSLIVMTEIGERALSPGINDPRTGLDVIGRITRMILRIEPETPLELSSRRERLRSGRRPRRDAAERARPDRAGRAHLPRDRHGDPGRGLRALPPSRSGHRTRRAGPLGERTELCPRRSPADRGHGSAGGRRRGRRPGANGRRRPRPVGRRGARRGTEGEPFPRAALSYSAASR